jgi:hypothetical protein
MSTSNEHLSAHDFDAIKDHDGLPLRLVRSREAAAKTFRGRSNKWYSARDVDNFMKAVTRTLSWYEHDYHNKPS